MAVPPYVVKAFVLHFVLTTIDMSKIWSQLNESPAILLVLLLSIFICVSDKSEALEIIQLFIAIEAGSLIGFSIVDFFFLTLEVLGKH